MRSLLAAAALLSATPSVATAQLANRSISLESGVSTALGTPGPAVAAFAISASRWLEGLGRGDLDGVLRVSYASAPRTTGRGPAGAVVATAGLRLSLRPAPLRPQLLADLGWARLRDASSRLAFGLGAALEWFPVPDVSVSARAGLRGAGTAMAGEGVLAFAAYF